MLEAWLQVFVFLVIGEIFGRLGLVPTSLCVALQLSTGVGELVTGTVALELVGAVTVPTLVKDRLAFVGDHVFVVHAQVRKNLATNTTREVGSVGMHVVAALVFDEILFVSKLLVTDGANPLVSMLFLPVTIKLLPCVKPFGAFAACQLGLDLAFVAVNGDLQPVATDLQINVLQALK